MAMSFIYQRFQFNCASRFGNTILAGVKSHIDEKNVLNPISCSRTLLKFYLEFSILNKRRFLDKLKELVLDAVKYIFVL